MNIRITGGSSEDGVVVGNTYDKYGSKNFVVKKLMNGFTHSLLAFIQQAAPKSINEIGCGEGHWVIRCHDMGYSVRGCDYSNTAIQLARQNAIDRGMQTNCFKVESIYDLIPEEEAADLVICCEVLEHLQDPESALKILKNIPAQYFIFSVPREPLWCALNALRGKYLSRGGNTPGHIQHWSQRRFIKFISTHFEIVDFATPLPWTMVLCRPIHS